MAETLDIAFEGQPFAGAIGEGINLQTMDYAYCGQPFVVNFGSSGGGTPPLDDFIPWICFM